MENVTYPVKEINVAEISVCGVSYRFRIPPVIGTPSECFKKLSSDPTIKVAKGSEIAAYATGALDPNRKNEWQNIELIKFPSKNYLRFPAVLTIIPKRKDEFGELESGMLVDLDLEGEGVEKQTEVPKDFSGWQYSDGMFVKENRIFLPYDKWYQGQWDENNGVVIALCSREGAEMLAKTAKDSNRNYKPLWKVDPKEITSLERRVPVLVGFNDCRLSLYCDDHGDSRNGCGVGVLK